jgi:hypothetical protein
MFCESLRLLSSSILIAVPPPFLSALAFWLISGPADQALEWATISASTRSSIKSSYAAAGVKLIVSAFGSTDAPTSTGANPTTTANNLAAFVIQYGLDGVDVDYEVGLKSLPNCAVRCDASVSAIGLQCYERHGWECRSVARDVYYSTPCETPRGAVYHHARTSVGPYARAWFSKLI